MSGTPSSTAVPAGTPAPRRPRRPVIGSLRDYAITIALLALVAFLALRADNFLTAGNLRNVLEQSAGLGIVAAAGTLVIIAGGFDLSVGAIFAIAGVVAAEVAVHGDPTLAIFAGILTGAAFGVGNGLLVTVARINPFIATLGSAFLIGGIAVRITHGDLITVDFDSPFTHLGSNGVLGLKYSVWIWFLFAFAMGVLLSRTVFGRYVFATGGNREAARLSGGPVGLVRTATYTLSGLAAGIAGVLSASRIGTGQADANSGVNLELQAVAAIIVGGTSIWGGEGAVWRTVVGVLLLGVIGNGFTLMSIDPVYQNIVYGGIILIAAGVDARLRRGAS